MDNCQRDPNQKQPTYRAALATLIAAVSAAIVVTMLAMAPAGSASDERSAQPPQPPLSNSDSIRLLAAPRFAQPSNWKWGYFKNADCATIRYGFAAAEQPVGTVVLLPGFTEFGEVYFETIKEFLAHR